jgi:hypothetical protein
MEDRVSGFLDIDTRRAMGLPPRRLQTPLPDIRFPTKKSATFGPISIKISPFSISAYFTVHVTVEDVYYITESEYTYDTGRTVTRLSGGPSHHRLYQIVEIPDEPETTLTKELWKVHRRFEGLRAPAL